MNIMRYSIEPRDRRYVKGYGFLLFAKIIGKNLSNKYGQKLIDSAKQSSADAFKTANKKPSQKIDEASGDLVGNKIADNITSYSKKSPDRSTELHSNESNNKVTKERYISLRERQKILMS